MRDEIRESPPTLRYARREALFVTALWVACFIYTVIYCYLFGYSQHPPVSLFGFIPLDLAQRNRSAGDLNLIFGIPDWVVWGVFAPWLLCTVLSVWFCLCFFKDEDLGEDRAADRPVD